MFLITAIIVSFNEQTSVSYPVRVMLTHFTQMILVLVSRTLSVLVSAECCSTMVQMKQLTLRPLHGQCMLFFYSFFFWLMSPYVRVVNQHVLKLNLSSDNAYKKQYVKWTGDR